MAKRKNDNLKGIIIRLSISLLIISVLGYITVPNSNKDNEEKIKS